MGDRSSECYSGFSADHEVGVRGYRIDIAVKHKDFGGWIMAVETDGATYHSSRAARDRDLLRQEILEGYGWVFHRIWSTDWLNDPVGVKERLRSALLHRVEMLKNDLERLVLTRCLYLTSLCNSMREDLKVKLKSSWSSQKLIRSLTFSM